MDHRAREGSHRRAGKTRRAHGAARTLLGAAAQTAAPRCRRVRHVGNRCSRHYNMIMPDRLDPAALKKRLKTLEAQAKESQRTIDELKSRDALKTQFLSNISH